jgi:hypothetical protein
MLLRKHDYIYYFLFIIITTFQTKITAVAEECSVNKQYCDKIENSRDASNKYKLISYTSFGFIQNNSTNINVSFPKLRGYGSPYNLQFSAYKNPFLYSIYKVNYYNNDLDSYFLNWNPKKMYQHISIDKLRVLASFKDKTCIPTVFGKSFGRYRLYFQVNEGIIFKEFIIKSEDGTVISTKLPSLDSYNNEANLDLIRKQTWKTGFYKIKIQAVSDDNPFKSEPLNYRIYIP